MSCSISSVRWGLKRRQGLRLSFPRITSGYWAFGRPSNCRCADSFFVQKPDGEHDPGVILDAYVDGAGSNDAGAKTSTGDRRAGRGVST